MMTEDYLQDVEARTQEATPGEWIAEKEAGWITRDDSIICQFWDRAGNDFRNASANMTFVAHARTDVPALVAEVRRLQSAVATANERTRRAEETMGRWAVGVEREELQMWARAWKAAAKHHRALLRAATGLAQLVGQAAKERR